MKKFGILLLLLGIFAFVGCPKQDAAPVQGDQGADVGDPTIEDPLATEGAPEGGAAPAAAATETPAEGSGAPARPAINP